MPKTAAAAHAGHDELLIARLYGSDVNDRERARALELVAGCDECAALYADLGAIAKATAALPVPSRPRDFALTDEDAARLRPRRRGWARLLGVGRRRSFGGALVALGFSGLVLTSALSMFVTVATSASLDAGVPGERLAAQAADASGRHGLLGEWRGPHVRRPRPVLASRARPLVGRRTATTRAASRRRPLRPPCHCRRSGRSRPVRPRRARPPMLPPLPKVAPRTRRHQARLLTCRRPRRLRSPASIGGCSSSPDRASSWPLGS